MLLGASISRTEPSLDESLNGTSTGCAPPEGTTFTESNVLGSPTTREIGSGRTPRRACFASAATESTSRGLFVWSSPKWASISACPT